MKDITKLSEQVEYVLTNYLAARNSYNHLWFVLITEFYPSYSIYFPIKDLDKLKRFLDYVPNFETVKKAAQRLIKKHQYCLYLPTEISIARKRGISDEDWLRYNETVLNKELELWLNK